MRCWARVSVETRACLVKTANRSFRARKKSLISFLLAELPQSLRLIGVSVAASFYLPFSLSFASFLWVEALRSDSLFGRCRGLIVPYFL